MFAATLLAICLLVLPQSRVAERTIDDWRAIAANDYALPAGASALELLLELSKSFGSTDAELRDELGYGISADWIYRQRLLDERELNVLTERWARNLGRGLPLGEGSDRSDRAVLARSFSALGLSLLAAHDLQASFLDRDAFDALLDETLLYLRSEEDLRGWVAGIGWIHATAHTADVLKFLARNALLTREQQHELLQAIADRLTTTGELVFVHGEQDRLARVLLALFQRDDFEQATLERFLSELARLNARQGATFDPVLYAGAENVRQLLRCTVVALDAAELPARSEALRQACVRALAEL